MLGKTPSEAPDGSERRRWGDKRAGPACPSMQGGDTDNSHAESLVQA